MMRKKREIRETLKWKCVGDCLLLRKKGDDGCKLCLLS